MWKGLFVAAFAAASAARAEPLLVVQPSHVRPGDALLVTVLGVPGPPEGTAADRPLAFYPSGGAFRAVAPLPVELPPGEMRVKASAPSPDGGVPVALEASVIVEEPHFRARALRVAAKFVRPPPEVRRWIQADRAAFAQVTALPFEPPLFEGNFAWPRDAAVTARFGDQRLFNGKKQSQHYGVDLEGALGDPVLAANDGRVVLVRRCYASGGSVVIAHGAGLTSYYFHLSTFEVREGQAVVRGEHIGRVGRSGRATGPHLHFGVKAGGLFVNPESVLRIDFRREP